MSDTLPARASLEYLRKLAKERLRELRHTDPDARLADAQLAIARAHGFPSWRALKAAVDRQQNVLPDAFLEACTHGDLAALRTALDHDAALANARTPDGATTLHLTVQHPAALRMLLEHGADPNVRDIADNALPLHAAAARGPLDSVRALLDGGSDVHGHGDAHNLDVIGWATVWAEPRRDVVDLLVARGARHHVFTAIALGDHELLRRVVAEDEHTLARRLSRFEQEQTALHYVIAPPDGLLGGTFRTGEHYRTLELLLELGADLDARDARGRTPLDVAMLHGDDEAMPILHAAGARAPQQQEAAPMQIPEHVRRGIGRLTPMLLVRDMEATVAWYQSLGFALTDSNLTDGKLDFATVQLGEAELMFSPGQRPWNEPVAGVRLWIHVPQLDELYDTLKQRQLARARALLGQSDAAIPEVRFAVDLHTAFYGQREFGIIDPNGVVLNFFQPLPRTPAREHT